MKGRQHFLEGWGLLTAWRPDTLRCKPSDYDYTNFTVWPLPFPLSHHVPPTKTTSFHSQKITEFFIAKNYQPLSQLRGTSICLLHHCDCQPLSSRKKPPRNYNLSCFFQSWHVRSRGSGSDSTAQ